MIRSHPNRPLPRVLLIDDDAISREVLAMMLEMHGFPVDSVEGGAEALEYLEKAAAALPEVIVMDAQMPGLSGMELVTALRQASNARVVAISGSKASGDIRQATDGFLLKPVEPDALKALLDALDSAEPDKGTKVTQVPDSEPEDAAERIPLIDPIVLGKLKAMMPPTSVREIYVAVAADMTTRLVALEAAIDAGNAKEVARIGHTIKGGCVMVGLTSAAQAAARLEAGNPSGSWQKERMQLHSALTALQSILVDGLP